MRRFRYRGVLSAAAVAAFSSLAATGGANADGIYPPPTVAAQAGTGPQAPSDATAPARIYTAPTVRVDSTPPSTLSHTLMPKSDRRAIPGDLRCRAR
jgi:hypothetical protein